MRAKARLISVVAVLLMALADRSLSTGSAAAEENCLAAPNAPAAPGSHWYYRTDSVKQSKCWYLRAAGQAIQTPAAQQKTETSVVAKWPAAAMPKTAPYQSAPEAKQVRPVQALADRLAQWSIQDGAQLGRQARADTVAWPDPPSLAGADNVVWPDPPSQTGGARQRATSENAAEERANQTQEEPATAANPDKGAGNDAGVATQIADPIEAAGAHSEWPAGLFLAFAFGLVTAGMIVRRMVRMTIARRRTVFIDRRERVETTNVASDIPVFVTHHHDLAPKWVDNGRPNDEVKEALRKLLLVVDRQAV
jgi:hypothetical protein